MTYVNWLNRCKFTAVSSGSGTFTVAGAVQGYKTPAQAGAIDSLNYRYFAESADRSEWEIGTGVYTSTSATLTRATVLYSSNSNAAVSFTAPPSVGITEFAEDLGRPSLAANTTFYVRTAPTAVTIPVASPAVVNWSSHGLSIGDAVVLSLPLSRQTVTVTIASPAVFSATGHGLAVDDPISFETTGALPTGLTAGTTYYVISTGLTADAFEVSTSVGGAAVNTSGSQSGTHKLYRKSSLPTGIADAHNFVDGGTFYVISAGFGANSFQIATSAGGTALNATAAGAGLIYAQTGNDSNDGGAATRSRAWLTAQGAFNNVAAYDLRDRTATIQLADGTYQYSGSVVVPALYSHGNLGGSVILQGNIGSSASRDNVVWVIQNLDNTWANTNILAPDNCVNATLTVRYMRFYVTHTFTEPILPNADFLHMTINNCCIAIANGADGIIYCENSCHLGVMTLSGTHDIISYGTSNALTVVQSSSVGATITVSGVTFNNFNNPLIDTWGITFAYAQIAFGSNTYNGSTQTTARAIAHKYGAILGNSFPSADPPPTLASGSIWLPNFTVGSLPVYYSMAGAGADRLYSYVAPTNGFTINVSSGIGNLILNAAGSVASGTVNLPTGVLDGQLFTLRTCQEVTSLTIGAQSSQTISSNAPTTLGAGKKLDAIYKYSLTTWFVNG